MSEIQEVKQLLLNHIKDSSKGQSEILQSIAKIETHGVYTKKTLQDHEDEIEKLKTARNKQKGAMWVLSGLTGIIGFYELVKNVFK